MMFEIKNVSKRYGTESVLKEITMTIGAGLNFIIGASGSGKTTLLQIMSGMDQNFEGEVLYCGKSVKTLTERERSYYYNNVFGFIWQDFNLLDDLTVLENVMLPQYLKTGQDKKAAMKVLRELKIDELAGQKAGKLSGGQKQRTAIARELLKNPQVIFADEPTSALDEKSAKMTMDILRRISKDRTVIVVTHDTSLIDPKAGVYELDKGELLAAPCGRRGKTRETGRPLTHRLSFANACRIGIRNARSRTGRFAAAVVSLLAAAILLLVAVSGVISDSSRSAFADLFADYGQGILDISVVGSFISAGGTDGAQNDGPSANVTQNIDGFYDKYLEDKRVAHIVFTQAYQDIHVTVDGTEYPVETSNSVPVVEELTAGVMPMGSGREVVVPHSFVEKMGIPEGQAIGKTILFQGTIYNWDSGNPVPMPVSVNAEIVGVADTTVRYDAGGQITEYSVEDSFFFSKAALDEMRAQAGIRSGDGSFVIRAKTPADLIAIKEELNAAGIVPLGRFELVEDIVRLGSRTDRQSGSAVVLIGILSVAAVLAVALMTALTRKREYAIYKVSGYGPGQAALLSASEALLTSAASALVFLCISPILNYATTKFWNVALLNSRMLGTGVLLVLLLGVLSGIVTIAAGRAAGGFTSLKSGER